MINDLTNFKTMSKDEIMRLTGQEDDSGGGAILLPRLSINRVGEDDDGNKLEVGTYTIYDPESEKKVYSKKGEVVKLRPFIRAYQYMEYNPDENNYANKTIIFKSWKDEPLDTLGGVKCGKIPYKELETLSKEDIMNLRGTVNRANGGYMKSFPNQNLNIESLTASDNIDNRIMKNLQFENQSRGTYGTGF